MSTPIPIGPTLSRIGQIFVNVKDLDRAIVFYRDRLGMKFLFQAPPNMAFFDCDGIRLMLEETAILVRGPREVFRLVNWEALGMNDFVGLDS